MGSGSSLTDGTLYGAIYAAEYVMRMSAVPSMLYVGMHALTGTRGVSAANSHYIDVQNAYNVGATIDTLSLTFGFFTTAQPLGLAVLNGVLRDATIVDATSVTGGATVPATGFGQIPALYAQAYTSAAGLQSVAIANKGAAAHQVTIDVNGTPVAGTLPLEFIAGNDPTVVNTAASPNTVAVETSTSANPVTVPAYSVVRVDLNSPAAVTAVNNASYSVGAVAPQEIVSLFGTRIAPLATPGSTTVRITDSAGTSQPAQTFYVGSGQANILIPAGLAAGPATVALAQGAVTALTGAVTIAGAAPGLYSMNSDGAGVAAANAFVVTAASQVVNQTVFTCNVPVTAARSCLPAPLSVGGAGDTLYVALYGTGIRGAASVQCFVAGQSMQVLYAGPVAAYPGLDQVNISIPKSLAGAGVVRIYLVADGTVSNVVALKIQ